MRADQQDCRHDQIDDGEVDDAGGRLAIGSAEVRRRFRLIASTALGELGLQVQEIRCSRACLASLSDSASTRLRRQVLHTVAPSLIGSAQ